MNPVTEAEFSLPDGAKISLRRLVEADLPALEWEGQFTHFRKLYQQHYANTKAGSTRIWVAVNDAGLVIGQVFILLYAKNKEIADGKNRAYLFSFRIRQEWRGLGIGSFMMGFVENYLLSNGFQYLRLNVARDNPRAIELYKKLGYTVMGPESGIWRYEDHKGVWRTVHEPAWKMIKELKAEG